MEIVEFMGIKLFKYYDWDALDSLGEQYYDVEWLCESMKQYDGHIIAIHYPTGNIDIYDGENILLLSSSVYKIKEWKESALKLIQ